ncbi:hypothetical protein, partial [Marinicella meishanensis]|uniref:hypothetical protein n=1 Tax=Marinicella meishanensis TaxID=2873263 RepID=UPI001CBC8A17
FFHLGGVTDSCIHRLILSNYLVSDKPGAIQVDLSKEIREIEEAVNTIDAEEVKAIEDRRKFRLENDQVEDESTPEWVSKALEVASVSPESAILISWKELEREINLVAHKLGIAQASRSQITSTRCLQYLMDTGRLSKKDKSLIMKMKRLRNEVVHSGKKNTNLTEENVISYMAHCEYLIQRISKLR